LPPNAAATNPNLAQGAGRAGINISSTSGSDRKRATAPAILPHRACDGTRASATTTEATPSMTGNALPAPRRCRQCIAGHAKNLPMSETSLIPILLDAIDAAAVLRTTPKQLLKLVRPARVPYIDLGDSADHQVRRHIAPLATILCDGPSSKLQLVSSRAKRVPPTCVACTTV
jgi:hypothetical protein